MPPGAQGLDRYAYVGNSPVRYTDPTGHRECENFDDNGHCTDPNGLAGVLLHVFGWITEGEWRDKDLSEILIAGRDIKKFVNGIIPGKGQAWMDKFMYGTTFVHGNLFGNHYVTGNTVHLTENVTARWVTHELGHVYDNRSAQDMGNYPEALWFGGGNADLMHYYLGGGVPTGLRWINGTSFLPDSYQFSPRTGYGNHSTADYYAEVFALAMYPDPIYKLPGDAIWGPLIILQSYIRAEGSFLN